MFIDTHCHLTDDYCSGDNLGQIISCAADAGVDTMVCATANPNDIPRTLEIINTYDSVFATIGIHPEYAGVDAEKYLTDAVLGNPRVIGIGEIGLDYYYGDENRTQQIELFEQQLDIARRHKMPVAIHSRKADNDTVQILTGDVRGVMHCFTGSWEFAKQMLNRGFFFSASGILTFKNADKIRETFAKIPLDRIVIETDAPYCAPVPHRGKTCQPAMVIETARVLADVHGVTMDALGPILRENTKQLYPKIEL